MSEKFPIVHIDFSEDCSALYLRLPTTLDDNNHERVIQDIAEQIYRESTRGSFDGTHIIIRDGMQRESPFTKKQIQTRFKKSKFYFRISGFSIQFLTTRKTRSISISLSDEFPVIVSTEKIAELLIRKLLYDNNAIYDAGPSSIFELPSGLYTKLFYRVGNIQSSPGILDDIFYFLYSDIYGIRAIVCDTWSISTLCHHIAHRLRDRYESADPLDTSERENHRVLVRFLDQYIIDESATATEFESVAWELLQKSKIPILVLFSAVFTGLSWKAAENASLAAFKRSRVGGRVTRPFRKIAVVKLSERADVGALTRCLTEQVSIQDTDTKHIIPINKKTYFPNYISSIEKSILPFVDEYREFYLRYAGTGVFSLHRQSTSLKDRIRHNTFHVDMEKMFETSAFQVSLKNKLFEIRRPEYVFFLNTKANNRLYELVRETYQGESITAISAANWEELAQRVPKDARKSRLSDRVWVLESVSITGGTLGVYAKWVRDTFENQPITYLIGLNRPDSRKQPEAVLRNLTGTADGTHNFIVIETVVIPNWGKEKCPWCRERAMIMNLKPAGNGEIDQFFNARAGVLDGRELVNNCFLVDSNFSESYRNIFAFGRDSYFFDLKQCPNRENVSEADVICCVATTAELWRAQNRNLPFRTEVATTPRNRLSETSIIGPTAFTDPILRASIWRTFEKSEIFPNVPLNLYEFFVSISEIVSGKNNNPIYRVLSLESILLFEKRIRNLNLNYDKISSIERYMIKVFENS